MEYTDFKIERLGDPTLDSPLNGIDFVPDDANVAYFNDTRELARDYRNFIVFTLIFNFTKVYFFFETAKRFKNYSLSLQHIYKKET